MSQTNQQVCDCSLSGKVSPNLCLDVLTRRSVASLLLQVLDLLAQGLDKGVVLAGHRLVLSTSRVSVDVFCQRLPSIPFSAIGRRWQAVFLALPGRFGFRL